MTKSSKPQCAKPFMMCHAMGLPPTGTIGFGTSTPTPASLAP